ncbi:MAG: type IV toxin-antitoxin system AbiEi family antitoxin domain-containing protein [Lachnospiraceae bacterium]|nr:type IV toxin-antitoxin system AbiEi family antitoxin domain-containing protein [Lachnospiraceae bacterium]
MSRSEKKEFEFEMIEKLIEQNKGIVRTKQITDLGIDYRRIISYVEEGRLIRVKSGYYAINLEAQDEEELIAGMFPDGILTMESALYYYGYLEVRPFVWKIAVSKNTSKSRFKMDYPALEPYYSEKEVLSLGVTTTKLGNSTMKIYTKDRLICDVLKYEEKMKREDFKKAALSYIQDDDKDVSSLMDCAAKRKVLRKVQNMIGVWL